MCLDTVDKEIKVKEGIGWKVFNPAGGGRVYSWLQHGGSLRVGKWITDVNETAIGIPRIRYPAGFHVWLKPEPAKTTNYGVVRPVSFRTVVASGIQNDDPVVVAREIRIFTAKEAKEYENTLDVSPEES